MPETKGVVQKKLLRKSFKIYFFIILFLVAVGFFLFLILIKGRYSGVSAAKICGDGSLYGTCSLDKPYYCDEGSLVENASYCGCPQGSANVNGSCFSQYQTGGKSSLFWYVLDGKNETINYTLYKGLSDYLSTIPESIFYASGEAPQRSDFTLKRLDNSQQNILLEPLVKDIENLAPNNKVNQARIAISLVQNIPWGASSKKINFAGISIDYSRYPYQVLYDDMGLCGEKSELLAYILRDLGYGVALFYYPDQNHEAVGVKCPAQDSLNGTGYCFVETSGPAILSDSHLVYAGGVTLNNTFQLIVLSSGISLPANIPEYSDAKKIDALRERMFLDPISSYTLQKLKKKYGLAEVYSIN